MNRDARIPEGELRRLDRTARVRRVDGIDTFLPPALTELASAELAALGELARKPAGRDPGLVVGAERVRLEDDLDAHRRATSSTAVPASAPLRNAASASFASSSANLSTFTRTGTCGAIARNSSPSRRVRLATDRKVRSPQRSSYGKP